MLNRKIIGSMALSVIIGLSSLSSARAGSISQVPLYLGGAIDPNVMLTLDDSGSMQWEIMPDAILYTYYLYPRQTGVYGGDTYQNLVADFDSSNGNWLAALLRSPAINRIYYNPDVTYTPWSNSDGTLMPAANPTCAPHNPYLLDIDGDGQTDCRNLTVANREWGIWRTIWGWRSRTRTFWPAVYYRYNGGNQRNVASYTRVEIRRGVNSYANTAGRADCAASTTCTYDEEIQNFANWYTYYRSRILLARAGIGRAFARQSTDMRVGFASINHGRSKVDGVWTSTVIKGVRPFSGTHRESFFDSLYGHVIPRSGTPLRRALDNVGRYFQRPDNRGPWGRTPGSDDSADHLACRQSYNILMTDGYWNGRTVDTPGARNADDTDGPTINGPDGKSYKYTPSNPYQDGYSDTLADVAMYYWNRDLRDDLENKVPENAVDEAFWQHLVNFTVGLGVTGSLDPETDLEGLESGTISWPRPVASSETTVDDLWHAAVNSRGGFFSAHNPSNFADALTGTLRDIVGRMGSSSTIATNSTRLNTDTFIYQGRFDSNDWHGELRAYRVDTDTGEIVDSNTDTTEVDPVWEAGALLTNLDPADRKIFTYDESDANGDGIKGAPFRWASLSPEQKAWLNIGPSGPDGQGLARIAYLRGEREKERDGTFRERASLLGDIVNSDPWFVGEPDYGYSRLEGSEGDSYLRFRNSRVYQNRPAAVYVGANDGMLHAFDAASGRELFAYVPGAIIRDLWRLTDPGYRHRYYVDAPPVIRDARIRVDRRTIWRTLLIGSAGAGGKSVFVLDVTDPSRFSKKKVLWEFTAESDDLDGDGNADGDLGHVLGPSTIIRLSNGKWGAIFGNGYDSPNNKAVLFIVDAATGEVIRKIDTGIGDAANPNGLSSPLPVDVDNDGIADRIYAGDIQGNLWAFDISDSDDGGWSIAYSTGGGGAPLFTARDEDGKVQPITQKPQSIRHPKGGVLVLFGTGTYYAIGDGSRSGKNSFYGLWDDFGAVNPGPISNRRDGDGVIASLLRQAITHESTLNYGQSVITDDRGNETANPHGEDIRVTSDREIDWERHKGWYIDLKSPVPGKGWQGERSVSSSLVRDDRVVFATLIPNDDACSAGGDSWLMELRTLDGARLPVTPFDLNSDGVFDEMDYVDIKTVDPDGQGDPVVVRVPVSGKLSGVGIIKTPTVIKDANNEAGGKEYKYNSGSTGGLERTTESRSYRLGRQSWQQLR